jgi:hypothetical protein
VEDGFQAFASRGVGEDPFGQHGAEQAPVWADQPRTKAILDLCQSWLSRLNDLVGDNIRVQNSRPHVYQQLRGRRFPHADATRESEDCHVSGDDDEQQGSEQEFPWQWSILASS